MDRATATRGPARVDRRQNDRRLVRQLAVWGVGALPLAIAAARLGEPPLIAAWLAIGGALIVTATPTRNWLIIASTATIHAAILTATSNDPASIAYLSALLLALALTATGLTHPTFRPNPTAPTAPSGLLALPLVAATLLLAIRPSYATAVVASAPGAWMLILANFAPRTWTRADHHTTPLTQRLTQLHHRLNALATLAGRAVAHALLAIAWHLVTLLPWAASRTIGHDPLWGPRTTTSTWITRETNDQPTANLWLTDTTPTTARHHLVPTTITLATILLIGIAWRLDRLPPWPSTTESTDRSISSADPTDRRSAAERLEGEPWFDEWTAAWTELVETSTTAQHTGLIYRGVRSEHLNYRDGVRRSWTPPAVRCPDPISVWAFGGSTMFGAGQRDDHTLPSELARAAWDDGVALHIENRGVPGDVAWIERRRLELALASGLTTPDLVIFYDGFNDLRSSELVYVSGRQVEGQFLSTSDNTLFPLVNRFVEVESGGRPELHAPAIEPNVRPADPAKVVNGAVFQYGHSIGMVDQHLRARSIPFLAYVQPWAATRDPAVVGDAPVTEPAREMVAMFRRSLPEHVIDITDVLDGTAEPYFTDDVHTTEAANPAIAERIWRDLEPLAHAITTRKGRSCA